MSVIYKGFTPLNKNKPTAIYITGFTLLEILIAALILALVMIGTASIFLAGKRHIAHTRSKTQAAELGKLFLAPLQQDVRQDTWDNPSTNALSIDTTKPITTRYCDSVHSQEQQLPNCPPKEERTLDGIEYSAQYDISEDTARPNLRKVVTTITWNEATP